MIIDIDNKNDLNKICGYNSSIVNIDFNNNPYIRYILYVSDNNILGFLCYEYIYDRYETDNLFVDEPNRCKGIGLLLIKSLIEKGKTDNIKNITLEVNIENTIAINLYKKVGFVEKAIRKKYYNGIDGILMEKEMM